MSTDFQMSIRETMAQLVGFCFNNVHGHLQAVLIRMGTLRSACQPNWPG
jgi:hypothetical protein